MATDESPAALTCEVIENALLVPSQGPVTYKRIEAGVFDEQGEPVRAAFLTRTWDEPVISVPPRLDEALPNEAPVVEEPHLFGGYLLSDYGHFLLESTARLRALEDYGPLPVVWAHGQGFTSWQREIFRMLGVSDPGDIAARPTRYRRLVIPEPGYRIQTDFHERQAHFLGRWRDEGSPGGEGPLVWLSRSKLSAGRRSPGEEVLEERLQELGWQVVHPETLSVEEQLRTIARAGAVAGLEGSAFHSVVLMAERRTPLLILRRGPGKNFATIADRLQLPQIDLYGAYRIADRRNRRLDAPRAWAGRLDALGREAREKAGDPSAFGAFRRKAQQEHAFEDWHEKQAGRRAEHRMTDIRARLSALRRRAAARFGALSKG